MVVSRLGDKQAHSARMSVVIHASWDLEKDDVQTDPKVESGKVETAG
jgi:hypothetical protein